MTAPIGQLLAIELDATELQVEFALLAGRFDDFSPVLGGAVLERFRQMERDVFDTEGAAYGPRWDPLAESTLRERARLGFPPGPILDRTHRLRKSVAAGRKTADSIVEVSPFGLTFGTSVEYADYHQQSDGFGLTMPLRQFIPEPVPPDVLADIDGYLRDWLIEGRARGRDQ